MKFNNFAIMLLLPVLSICSARAGEIYGLSNTLGVDSGYVLNEVQAPGGARTVTMFEVNDVAKSYNYVDAFGNNVVKDYVSKSLNERYYNVDAVKTPYNQLIINNGDYGDITNMYWDGAPALLNNGNVSNAKMDVVFAYNSGYGGTIYNSSGAVIKNITGDFIGNRAGTFGGVFFNANGAEIDSISGNFIGNTIDGFGGVLSSYGQTKSISGNFINNVSHGNGGAIDGDIGERISGNFIGNHADYCAGAIQVEDVNPDEEAIVIEGNFIGNNANGHGGAIVSEGQNIKLVKGNFIGNYVKNETSPQNDAALSKNTSYGGAITNDRCFGSALKEIVGNFIDNYVESVYSPSWGGAVSNFHDEGGNIGSINANFIGNYVYSQNASAHAGAYAARSLATLDSMKGEFALNSVQSGTQASGGAIFNENSRIGDISADFILNSAYSENANAYGGAIFNSDGGVIGGKYTDLYGVEKQGALNGSFYGNAAKSDSSDKPALGGAIFTSGDITFKADGTINAFSGNYTEDARGRINNAIFVRTNQAVFNSDGIDYEEITPEINFKALNNGTFILNDTIDGGELTGTLEKAPYENLEHVTFDGISRNHKYNLNFEGDKSGKILLNNTITNANIALSDVLLQMKNETLINNNNLTLNSGTINMINNSVGVSALNSLTVKGDTLFYGDVDLANEQMDRFTAKEYGSHSGDLVIGGLNLLSDMDKDKDSLRILFAENGLKDNVRYELGELPHNVQTEFYTPIYRYKLNYEKAEDAGYFTFMRGGFNGGSSGGQNNWQNFNPAVLATPASTQAGAQAALSETFRYVFQHADAFTQLPQHDRFALMNSKKYAISTDFNNNLSAINAQDLENSGVWVRPYTTFESINLKNGPTVDVISYGTLVGFDSDFKELKHGWHSVFSGYAGYSGANLGYNNVDTQMNGGMLGFTETFYKGNFWSAITASAGASVAQTYTMYGSENSTMLMSGIGSKTGYNFEFKEGKFIIQPIMFLSYTFVNTFDYTNAAGVKIDSDPLHTIQINPSIRFIGNLKNGWQPYASVGMVWNALNQTSTTANDITLPNMHIKPYVEYGLGIQRRWADRFTAFFQTMIRNGGRNGVAFTGGFRWAVGKDYKGGKTKHTIKQDL